MLDEKRKLQALKTIAETLNECQNKQEMLQSVLKQLIEITHFRTGWIFIEHGNMQLGADEGLPEALSIHEKAPLCGEDCYCISKYKTGKLTKATNIIECKRLNLAIQQNKYDTEGLSHHATVPLKTPEKSYGLLNVAAPNRSEYIEEELNLLESVAYQIGTALRRIEQYEQEEERVRLLEKLNDFVQHLRKIRRIQPFITFVSKYVKDMFSFSGIQLTIQQYDTKLGDMENENLEFIPFPEIDGQLLYATPYLLSPIEEEILQLIINHTELTYRDLVLQEKETSMARVQERARLAQDLHDSVSQLLFSIVLTSRAAKHLFPGTNEDNPIQDIYDLSTQALQEMRSLIAGQKPTALEKGLLTGLVEYAEKVKLKPNIHAEGSNTIPYSIEEALYRIGQEAIHNVKKHAKTEEIFITLKRTSDSFTLVIEDNGIGFDQERMAEFQSYGLKGMQERASAFEGKVTINSTRKIGTTIHVYIPNPAK
ncbi:signal transduction histidine kinase [Salirhabdus euzebyi]|uniref:histidine kinase n=1 Tax=Salirhabdus euzebyi TaxID=394506 RepID=A0A841Q1E5_9BACI|nr:GAF domain-containing sensor histidine kinase [Salirhabdus euzebyi]MBB6451832.1 signal transduction histidine kinase [Salirhabdus euzebyi]